MAIFKILGEKKSVFNYEKFKRELLCELLCDRQYSEEQIEKLKPKMIHHFRCCDDDGITYFWGVCSNDSSFAPLDCVGEDYGCTYIEYKNPQTGEYEQL